MPWVNDIWVNPEYKHESRLSDIPTVAGGIIAYGGKSAQQKAKQFGNVELDVDMEYFLYRLLNDAAIDNDMSTSRLIRHVLMEKFCPEYLE